MRVTFLSIDDCPNADLARQRLADALAILDLHPSIVTDTTVDTADEAERLGFRGSPSILIDGIDPFAEGDSPVGLSCRIYRTDAGVDGAPSVAALTAVAAMTAGWRAAVAAVVLVACCAGPALAGGAALAAITGFLAKSWWLFALAAVLCVVALIGIRRRSNPKRDDC